MLVFSEGVPRSGKSYDAVKNHILPALKSGRRVYARINGLNNERIAAYLKIPVESVQQNLHVIDTDKVVETFRAVQGEGGKWIIPTHFKNALIVIDEVHEFYVGGSRDALDPRSEQFFALHGHYGMDVLTMTQFYKRVHTAIRYRIERKNVFQKLSALGKRGESLYRETAFQTVAPDKYEKTGAQTRSYDKDVFPLYHGIVDGGESGVEQSVYGGGRVTIWKTLLIPSLIMLPLGGFAIWYLLNFFSGGGTALVKSDQLSVAHKVQPARSPGAVYQEPVAGSGQAIAKEPTQREKHLEAMTPEQRYVWDMTGKARIRFTGAAVVDDRVLGWVEWYDGSGTLLDQLSIDQVRALGVQVVHASYGLRLHAGDEAIIVTAWPKVAPVREPEPRLYDTSAPGLAVSNANLDPGAQMLPPANSTGDATRIPSSGAFR